MDINNLTNVYNNNPTLQGSYTLQQYLDLFGGTPPTATIPPTDPNAPTTPITPGQGIINANINQFQGGGDGGGITTIGSNRINSNNPTFRDPLNDLIESKLSVEDREKYSDNMYNIQETKTGFIDGVKNTATDLLDLYKTYSPMGFIGRKIEQAQKSKVERERVAFEKARQEQEAQNKYQQIEFKQPINKIIQEVINHLGVEIMILWEVVIEVLEWEHQIRVVQIVWVHLKKVEE